MRSQLKLIEVLGEHYIGDTASTATFFATSTVCSTIISCKMEDFQIKN